MSNENLAQDALATEEMLKMFEGIGIDDLPVTDELADAEITSDTLLEDLSLDDMLNPNEQKSDALDTDFASLAELGLNDHGDSEVLEMANDAETTSLLESLDTLEADDELAGLNFENMTENFNQSSDEEFPEADLTNVDTSSEVETLALDEQDNPAFTTETTPAETIAIAEQPSTFNEDAPIAEHLQAVVANAIQALQDWMELRQASESKGPQQSLAQLDVLLDTVTNQQQQLAEQLAKSSQHQLTQISSALGLSLATPQTLGWTANDWRIKAQQVADKTDDISQRNAKIREELARL